MTVESILLTTKDGGIKCHHIQEKVHDYALKIKKTYIIIYYLICPTNIYSVFTLQQKNTTAGHKVLK